MIYYKKINALTIINSQIFAEAIASDLSSLLQTCLQCFRLVFSASDLSSVLQTCLQCFRLVIKASNLSNLVKLYDFTSLRLYDFTTLSCSSRSRVVVLWLRTEWQMTDDAVLRAASDLRSSLWLTTCGVNRWQLEQLTTCGVAYNLQLAEAIVYNLSRLQIMTCGGNRQQLEQLTT